MFSPEVRKNSGESCTDVERLRPGVDDDRRETIMIGVDGSRSGPGEWEDRDLKDQAARALTQMVAGRRVRTTQQSNRLISSPTEFSGFH